MDQISLSQSPNPLRANLGLIYQNSTTALRYDISKLRLMVNNPCALNLPNSHLIVPAPLQRQVGLLLEKIYARNGAYKNPLAIARLLTTGSLALYVHKKDVDSLRTRLQNSMEAEFSDAVSVSKNPKRKQSSKSDEGKSHKLSHLVSTLFGLNDVSIYNDDFTFKPGAYVFCQETSHASGDALSYQELIQLKLLRDAGLNATLLHTANYGVYSSYISPAILALTSVLPNISIVSPLSGLNWDSYYVRVMWYRPIVRAALTDAELTVLIKSSKPIVLLGGGFPRDILDLAHRRGIQSIQAQSTRSSVTLKHRSSPASFQFISYLSKEKLEAKLTSEKGFIKTLIITSFPVGSLFGLPMSDFDASNYSINIDTTSLHFDVEDPGMSQVRAWQTGVLNLTIPPGEVLTVIGNKGSMKSTITEYIVGKSGGRMSNDALSRQWLGRVDSDTYGRWLANGTPSFPNWNAFLDFQERDDLASHFELLAQEILKPWQAEHDDTFLLRRNVYPKVFADVESTLAVESALLLNCKDSKPGYTLYASMIIAIPDLPKGLLWEVHYNEEIARIKSVHTIQIQSPLSTELCVLNRKRPTSTPLIELLLHDFYNSRSYGTAYPTVSLYQLARHFGYEGNAQS